VAIAVGMMAVASAPRLPAQPASPAIYMSDADLMATLKEAAKSAPAMHTAPVKIADHYPAGTPHWYKDLDSAITYLEVRFDLAKP